MSGGGAVLAQRQVGHKTNEITQVKPLLDPLPMDAVPWSAWTRCTPSGRPHGTSEPGRGDRGRARRNRATLLLRPGSASQAARRAPRPSMSHFPP